MLTDSFHMDTAERADPRGPADDAPTMLPFTVEADLDLGAALEPWLRASGADVTIRRGDVPAALAAPESEDVFWQHAGRQTLFRFPRGVRFLIEDGRSVRYAMERGMTLHDHDVRPFVLSNVWGALAMQRGLLPLHASSVARGPDLDAFTGRSGMGKSTLAAALGSHGYPLFTDDVLLVGPASFDAGPLCHGHRALNLGREGMALSGVRAAAPLRMNRWGMSLYKWHAVPARQARQHVGRLRRLYFPSYRSNVPGRPPCRVERLAGRQAVQVLRGAVYHQRQADAIMGRGWVVSLLAGILRHTRMFVFHRRRCDADMAWFAEDVTRLAAELRAP